MKKYSYYIQLFLRIAPIVIFTAISTYIFYSDKNIMLFIISVIAIIFSIFTFIKYLNKTNKKISYFFEAVENDDSTLYFPENTKDSVSKKLNRGLNRVNNLIREVKIKNIEQVKYFSALIEHLDTGIVVLDSKGNVLHANASAAKLLNYQTLTNIVQLKKVDYQLYSTFAQLKNGSRKLIKLTYKNNTTNLILQATSFFNRDVASTVVSIQDIRHELDTQEVDSWIKLIRVLTHEIMNSISPITSLSDTILRYFTNEYKTIDQQVIKNTTKGLKIIKERGEGLIDFVESYRKLTKIPTPSFEQTNIADLMDNISILLANEYRLGDINYSVNITPKNLTLNIDKIQITQVFINIVKNALEAVKDVENPMVKIYNIINKNNVIIYVCDNGKGILKENMEQIFIPFFTTKPKGTGIGLSLSKQIMRNHGGSIRVSSIPEKETVFTLIFSNMN